MEYLNLIDYIYINLNIVIGAFVIPTIILIIVLILGCFSKKHSINIIELLYSYLVSLLLIIMFIIVFIRYINFDKNKYISYEVTEETEYVSFLPNQIVNSDIDTFIINGEEFKTNRIDSVNVKYFEDSKEKPYIVVEKVTYDVHYKWYLDKKNMAEINSTEKYVLKEIHY